MNTLKWLKVSDEYIEMVRELSHEYIEMVREVSDDEHMSEMIRS